MSRDVVADMITSIRNCVAVKKRYVVVPHSLFKENIVKVLEQEGFIVGYEILNPNEIKKTLKIELKYINDRAVISEIKRISKQGRRVYSSAEQSIKNGFGIKILSTNKGVVSDVYARSLVSSNEKSMKLGGEVICTVW